MRSALNPASLTRAPNTKGLAFVDEGDLDSTEGTQAGEMVAKAQNPHVKQK